MEYVEKAKKIISDIIYVTVATASREGQPWNSPVYSAFDEHYNFYWVSWKENQHSKNIAENPNVFLAIYDSTVPEGTGQGVYVKASAYTIDDREEIKRALTILYSRKHQDPEKRKPEEFLGDYPRRVYKAEPEKFFMNADGSVNGSYIDTRVEVDLLSNN